MDPLNAQYDQVAAGTASPPQNYNDFKRMLSRARYAARKGTVEEQLTGIAVIQAIGGHWSMSALREFLTLPDVTVRRRALQAAVAEGEGGLLILRDLAEDRDVPLALEALTYLRRVVDRGTTGRARRLMKSDDPRIRQAAVELLGHIGGPGMAIPAGRLIGDPDQGVQDAAQEAYARLNGELPKDKPDPWWRKIEPEPWQPREEVALPEVLPEEHRDLLSLIGSVSRADRGAVLVKIATLSDASLRAMIRMARVGGPAELGIGVCVVAQLLERDDQVVPIRRLLPDHNPDVRIACAEALAVIGKPSVIMGLRDLLTDPYPSVRCAGLRALNALLPAPELARYAYAIREDKDASVQALLREIRGEPAELPSTATPAPEAPGSTQESP
ncbi:MAG: HEAT repeat protein [Myxococcota bacterium]|jgi:HEAT repeat protein